MKDIRLFVFVFVLTGFAPSLASGQITTIQPLKLAQDNTQPKEKIIKLTIHPASAPEPALKYRLLPELRDMESGNAVIRYYRAFSPEWANTQNKEYQKAMRQWAEDPAKMPPAILKISSGSLNEIDMGARRTYCDWDMLRLARKDGIAMLLPDVQGFRELNRLLTARTRFALADKNYQKAAYGLQTGFAFSRHQGDGPTLIQSLVGMAMAHGNLVEVEQWIQQKDSPNLYWSLTALPQPLIDLRRPLQGERLFLEPMFPGIRDMMQKSNYKPLAPHEVQAIIARFRQIRGLLGIQTSSNFETERLGIAVLAARTYPAGKRFLLQEGVPAKVVEKMPVVQVALLYELHNFDVYFDEMAKWYGLPFAQMQAGVTKAEKKLQRAASGSATVGVVIAGLFLPATHKVYIASYRLDRKVAALRCVEALRLHAAKHGKLPASLNDIKEVPVPMDPMTGKSFVYSVKENTAALTAPPPPGQSVVTARSNNTTWTYELTLIP